MWWKKELSGWTLEANNFTFWQTLTADTKLVADWEKTNATNISLSANSDWYKFIEWQKADGSVNEKN